MFSRPLAVLALVTGLAGCAGGPDASAPTRPMPPWQGHSRELFDDAIEPRAVGLSLELTRTPRTDPVLRERTQVGDAVLRVKVDTVTVQADGIDARYQIGLRVMKKLTGEHPPPSPFVVEVTKASPSFGIVKSLDARLSGKTFVAFVREFKTGADDPRIHFHLAPDTKDVLAAVSDASALTEIGD